EIIERFLLLSQILIDYCDVIKSESFAAAIAELSMNRQRLVKIHKRFVLLPQIVVDPAEAGEYPRFGLAITRSSIERQRLFILLGRLSEGLSGFKTLLPFSFLKNRLSGDATLVLDRCNSQLLDLDLVTPRLRLLV